ncbi:MAG: hypothetical protein ACI8P9_004955 [Parasphingorhabdus sp.]
MPALVAQAFYKTGFKSAYLWMLGGLMIDVDHLLADPIYDPNRCSVGFHPLHSLLPIGFYLSLIIFPLTRWLGCGLAIHIVLDAIDCKLNTGAWIFS